MTSRRPEWEVRLYGDQLEELDEDLMAQLVIMLGRELIQEANERTEGGTNESDNT